jgi:hypothetical protein
MFFVIWRYQRCHQWHAVAPVFGNRADAEKYIARACYGDDTTGREYFVVEGLPFAAKSADTPEARATCGESVLCGAEAKRRALADHITLRE